MSTTIILTSTVNVQQKSVLFQTNKQDRLNNYLKAVKQWLSNTKFKIVLVENSGYTFPELQKEKEKYKNKFEIISFQEREINEAKYLEREEGKGGSEMYAIHFAYYHSRLIRNSIFIIKITARFFIPELEGYLENKDLNTYDGLCQNDIDRCEMVGSHIKNFHIIFNKYMMNDNGQYEQHVENIYKTRMTWFSTILQCKLFAIEPTQRGGVDELIYYI